MTEILNGAALFNKLQSNRRTGIDLWIPTDEETFYEQLGCVPPVAMGDNCFAVGEAADHEGVEEVYTCFLHRPIKAGEPEMEYVAQNMTLKEFRVQMSKRLKSGE